MLLGGLETRLLSSYSDYFLTYISKEDHPLLLIIDDTELKYFVHEKTFFILLTLLLQMLFYDMRREKH